MSQMSSPSSGRNEDEVDNDINMEDMEHAQLPMETPAGPHSARIPLDKTFPQKLFRLMNDPDKKDLIRWPDDGNGFFIPNRDVFAERILGAEDSPFRTGGFESFVRSANIYDFHKVRGTNGTKECTFKHNHGKFHRDRPQDLEEVIRKAAGEPQIRGVTGEPTAETPRFSTRSPISVGTESVDLGAIVEDQRRRIDDLEKRLDAESDEHRKTKESLDGLWTEFSRIVGILQQHCLVIQFPDREMRHATSSMMGSSQLTHPAHAVGLRIAAQMRTSFGQAVDIMSNTTVYPNNGPPSRSFTIDTVPPQSPR
ncbi:stress-responsive transcription factor hsf1 [Tulasnella sp. JGI-2019a]|nr:stress-responsive transcription factor hsf1 [Tulasnella sp. JGI-2019a]KAG9003885.1 stress-responsive transcription factor hsf1 [Tulasnella sp. JGI-2019a]KAG9031880.1 stress-responsive transcription factor hsf1 [Tulasnella sp. JGI-2019a]